MSSHSQLSPAPLEADEGASCSSRVSSFLPSEDLEPIRAVLNNSALEPLVPRIARSTRPVIRGLIFDGLVHFPSSLGRPLHHPDRRLITPTTTRLTRRLTDAEGDGWYGRGREERRVSVIGVSRGL